jgi:putative heme-binding domain-containing protein
VGKIEFVQLAAAFGLGNRSEQLFDMLDKISGTAEADVAFQLLEKSEKGAALLRTAFSGPKALSLIDLLASIPAKTAQLKLSQLLHSPDEKIGVAAVRALARTQAGAEVLLEISRKGKFPAQLRSTASEALALVQFNDRDNKFKQELAAQFPPAASGHGGTLPGIPELLKKKGDPERGKSVFARLESSCVTCHKIGVTGADFGPNLSEIGTKLGRDALYDAILNPNTGISMGFETYEFKLNNGGSSVGILRSETADEIVVALPGGASQRLPKNEVKKREKLPHSMMPSGLGQILGEQNLVDLVEYLAACKAK